MSNPINNPNDINFYTSNAINQPIKTEKDDTKKEKIDSVFNDSNKFIKNLENGFNSISKIFNNDSDSINFEEIFSYKELDTKNPTLTEVQEPFFEVLGQYGIDIEDNLGPITEILNSNADFKFEINNETTDAIVSELANELATNYDYIAEFSNLISNGATLEQAKDLMENTKEMFYKVADLQLKMPDMSASEKIMLPMGVQNNESDQIALNEEIDNYFNDLHSIQFSENTDIDSIKNDLFSRINNIETSVSNTQTEIDIVNDIINNLDLASEFNIIMQLYDLASESGLTSSDDNILGDVEKLLGSIHNFNYDNYKDGIIEDLATYVAMNADKSDEVNEILFESAYE